MGKIVGCFLLITSCCAVAQGSLIEVDRVGQTRSIHYRFIENAEKGEPNEVMPKRLTPEEWYGRILPIRSELLEPGDVATEKRDLKNLLRPVFIIGSDNRSISWLKEHKEALLEINAIGLLVDVETIEQLMVVGEVGSGLQISPTVGDQFARLFMVSNYPVLVSKGSIEQ